MWTYDNDDDGYVHYIYWKGHIDSDWPRLSIKPAGDHRHILVISDAELNDTGLYDCYDGKRTRNVGYQLTIAGMISAVYCSVVNWKGRQSMLRLLTFSVIMISICCCNLQLQYLKVAVYMIAYLE